jgi:hypothetical protein
MLHDELSMCAVNLYAYMYLYYIVLLLMAVRDGLCAGVWL